MNEILQIGKVSRLEEGEKPKEKIKDLWEYCKHVALNGLPMVGGKYGIDLNAPVTIRLKYGQRNQERNVLCFQGAFFEDEEQVFRLKRFPNSPLKKFDLRDSLGIIYWLLVEGIKVDLLEGKL